MTILRSLAKIVSILLFTTLSSTIGNQLNAQDGKALFQQNCASCHAVNKKLTGIYGNVEGITIELKKNSYNVPGLVHDTDINNDDGIKISTTRNDLGKIVNDTIDDLSHLPDDHRFNLDIFIRSLSIIVCNSNSSFILAINKLAIDKALSSDLVFIIK